MTDPSPGTPEEVAAEAGGVVVRASGGVLAPATADALAELAGDGVASALAGKDATLWGPEATPEASVRLGWMDLADTSRALLPRIAALREGLLEEGLDHVVLAGMGGSSLAPEVITGTAGAALTVLDSTDPHQVRAALADALDRTVLVVSSKSGGTVETDSQARAYLQAFVDRGLSEADAHRRLVAVTDPGSPLEQRAREQGWREVFLADPDVGGRYSALTAFGLVPSGLAGVDIGALLDDAAAVRATLDQDGDNPGLVLGAALGAAGRSGHDKVVLADAGSGIAGFGDWAEQLVAESTGKNGRGLLPVVVEGTEAPGFAHTADTHLVTLGGEPAEGGGTAVSGPLGAQFLTWEYATAVAGRLLQINPFDQPNVQESKDNTNALLADGEVPDDEPAFTDGPLAVHGDAALLGDASTVGAALAALLEAVGPNGYLAVMAYLDRHAEADLAGLRPVLAARTAHPVTFGWGPRFLHSTGQYHKGGPQVGAFLQVTGAVTDDLDVPGRRYSFGTLQRAQYRGDARALAGRGRPFLRVHLLDRSAGVAALLRAAQG